MKTEELEVQTVSNPVLEEMAKAGLQFGHKTSKTHPAMKSYIGGVKSTIHVFDLVKTKEKLDEALEYITKLMQENKVLLLVGTKIQVKDMLRETAKACGLPYVSERWIGGTLTNFETFSKRIALLKDLQSKKEKGELEKYTKKELAKIQKELELFEAKFGGVKNLTRLPDALFVCDAEENDIAVREAKKMNIPVVAIVDTNCDPSAILHIIPANDDAISSVQFILSKVKEAILKGSAQPAV